jgi:hypothetical protein
VALAMTNVSIAASENYLFLETISQTCLVTLVAMMSPGDSSEVYNQPPNDRHITLMTTRPP